MLRCAPYIRSICDNFNNTLWAEEVLDPGPECGHQDPSPGHDSPRHDLLQKKESEVMVSDVKGFKVNVLEPKSAEVTVKDHSELYKIIKKIRPDSPDVIRAAKRFERTRSRLNSDKNLETIVEQSPDPVRELEVVFRYKIEDMSRNDR